MRTDGDYITREAAESALKQPVTMSMCLTLEECKMKNAQRQIDLFVIRGLPAADVRPVVRGEWKVYNNTYVCSACGRPVSFWQSNFCPNCGTDMREES